MQAAQRLEFGTFIAPFHKRGENPTLALRRDLDMVQKLDELGFDEAWIGEHHSAGWEIIASPEVFLAAAGERTQNIRLGTGVVSIPYHNPFHTADRIVLLDHLTRGRAMLGVGPGALPGDAWMQNIEPPTQRARMEEGLGIIIRLLTEDEPITYECDWFTLRDARLQLKPYQRPMMPIAVASTLSPAGMTSAGKHGVGVLSLASFAEQGLTALTTQWEICQEAAAKAGRPDPDRRNWRVVMPFHLAESREQAIADIEDGLLAWNNDYGVNTIGNPVNVHLDSGREVAERMISFGSIIGTPDDAITSIKRLQEISGGFGCILTLGHEWASWERTMHSYELLARYVMPQFQDTLTWIDRSIEWSQENQGKLIMGAKTAVLKAITENPTATAQLSKTVLPGTEPAAKVLTDEAKAKVD